MAFNTFPIPTSDSALTGAEGVAALQKAHDMPSSSVVNGLVNSSATISGLNITVSAFNVDGFSYDGGSVTCIDNETQYLVLTTTKKTLHVLDRFLDTGSILLAKLTSVGGVVTINEYFTPKLPRCLFPVTQQKIVRGEPVNISAIGTSLVRGAGSTPRWFTLVFDSAESSQGYNCANIDNVTYNTYALGGSNAIYAHAAIGNTTFATDGDGSGARTYAIDSKTAQRAGVGSSAHLTNQKMSASKVFDADLVIVGLLPNDGFEQLNYYEGVIRRLRQNNVEVLIVTDNEYRDISLIYDKGSFLSSMSKKYGCALADTAAFFKEQIDIGNDPYFDGIHQNVLGHQVWANAISSSLSGFYGEMVYSNIERTMLTVDSTFPAQSDVCFDFNTSTDLAPIARTLGGNGDDFTDTFSQPTDYYSLAPTEYMWGGHPLALGFYLMIDGDSAFTASLSTNDGSTVADVNWGGGQPRAEPIMLRDVDSSHNKAFKLTVNTGELKVIALVYIVPCYDDITTRIQSTDEFSLSAVSGTTITKTNFSDAIGEGVYVSHPECRSISTVSYSGSRAGQVRQYFTGTALLSEDLYKASTTLEFRSFTANGVSNIAAASMVSGVNGSASAVTSTAHRISWVNAFAVLDR